MSSILNVIYNVLVLPFIYLYEVILYILRQFFSDRIALYFIAFLYGISCSFVTAIIILRKKEKVRICLVIATIMMVTVAGFKFLDMLDNVKYVHMGIIATTTYAIFILINSNAHKKNIYSFMLSGLSMLFAIYVIYIGKVQTMLFNVNFQNIPGVFLYLVIVVVLNIPLVKLIIEKREFKPLQDREEKHTNADTVLVFVFEITLFLTYGIMIPSSIIAAAPMDFVTPTDPVNPLNNISTAICVSFGLFLVWGSILFYLLSNNRMVAYKSALFSCTVVTLFNYFFYGRNLGLIDTNLKFVRLINPQLYGVFPSILNLLICLFIAYICTILMFKKPAFINVASWFILAYVTLICVMNISMICMEYNKESRMLSEKEDADFQHMSVSTDGQNVILIMIDRGMGAFVPYILQEKEELKDQFSGFTYYRNTVSYANYTALAAPCVWGGYEYTPLEMNKRDSISWGTKTDEALLMLPRVLSDNGFNVFIADPPNASSIDIFADFQGISATFLNGVYANQYTYPGMRETVERDYFFYSVFKASPTCVQSFVYDDGSYMLPSGKSGVAQSMISSYAELDHLSDIIDINESDKNNYIVIYNDLPHNPMDLSYPDYSLNSDNDLVEYDTPNECFEIEGLDNPNMAVEGAKESYDVNMASMILLGKFLDYLKENDAYDNTRIIIVSDHGNGNLNAFDNLRKDGLNMQGYLPILLVKDFNTNGTITTSDEFMTNADVPSIVLKGIVEETVNPYTMHTIDSSLKNDGAYVSTSNMFDLPIYGSLTSFNTLKTDYPYFNVKKDAYDSQCWQLMEQY